MKVLLDHNAFSRQPHGGIPRYFTEVLSHSRVISDAELKVVSPLYTNYFLKNSKSFLVGGLKLPQLRGVGRLCAVANEVATELALATWKPDIVHETHYSGRSYDLSTSVRIVFTVHDLTPELFPQHFEHYKQVIEKRRKAFQSDAYFVAISENTRRDLMAMFNVPPDRIRVIHHGQSALPVGTSVERRVDQVLYVGGRGGYKNFENLVSAFRLSPTLSSDIELVVFGGGAATRAEIDLVEAAGIKRYRFTGGGDAELALAYREATIFAYPSLYEGFGLPLLEAMTSDCPIACSKASSFPEIAGDAAAFFDPTSPEDIAASILELLHSRDLRSNLVERGASRAREFSWDQSARDHIDFYKSIL